MENPVNPMGWRGFCLPGADRRWLLATGFFGKFWANHPLPLANSGHANAGPALPASESRTPLKRSPAKAADAPCAAANEADTACSQKLSSPVWPGTPRGNQSVGAKRKACGSVRARAPPHGHGRPFSVARHSPPIRHPTHGDLAGERARPS
jgi:hypothetical protein